MEGDVYAPEGIQLFATSSVYGDVITKKISVAENSLIHGMCIAIKDTEQFMKDTEEITKTTFEKYNIPYDKIIMNVDSKLEFCKQNNVEIFIDDSFETCKKLQENGIKFYLMNSKMNQFVDNDNIERVFSWNEIYEKIRPALIKSLVM